MQLSDGPYWICNKSGVPSCRVPIFRNGKLKRGKLPTLPLWDISPKLTARTWKLMVGSDEFPLRMAHFQVRGRVDDTPENITKGWKILPLSHERKQRLMVYFYTPPHSWVGFHPLFTLNNCFLQCSTVSSWLCFLGIPRFLPTNLLRSRRGPCNGQVQDLILGKPQWMVWNTNLRDNRLNTSEPTEFSANMSSWWFQPLWKNITVVKMGIFPK